MTHDDEPPAKRQPHRRMLRRLAVVVPPYLLQTVAWPLARTLFHVCARMQVQGHEQLRTLPRRVIFAGNHTSHLDPILVRAAVPYLTHIEPMFYVARQHKEYGWRGWRQFIFSDMFFRSWGAYPAYKGTGSYEKSLEKLVELARHDFPICIFPGGQQHTPGETVRAHGGVAHLAWAADALVVPVAISGTHASNMKSFFGRRVRFTVTFGNPIDVRTHIQDHTAPSAEDYKRAADAIAAEINTHWQATDPEWHAVDQVRPAKSGASRGPRRRFRTLRNLYQMLADLVRLYVPLPRGCDDIAFVVHPRDRADVHGKYPFLRPLGNRFTDWVTRNLWPVRVAPILGAVKADGTPIRGWVLACPMTAEQMLQDRGHATRTIQKAARLAEKRGAQILGLGALSASLSRGGLDVTESLPVRVTTGRLFTVYNVSDLVLHGLRKLHLPHREAHVAIVGAAGSIGAGVAQQLARHGVANLTLIDLSDKHEDVTHVANQVRSLNPDARVSTATSLAVLRDADAIVTATNRHDALVKSEHVQPGTLIVDDAQPSDLAPEIFVRNDLLVLEGGVIHAPHLHVPYKMGLKEKGDIFSCMAELMVLAYDPTLTGSTLGRSLTLDTEAIDALAVAADTIGLTRAKLQNMHRLFTEADIAHIRSCRVRSKE